MPRPWARLFPALLLVAGCSGGGNEPAPDAPVPLGGPWTGADKCATMCQSYCVHLNAGNGTDVGACRMTIDHANGGDCEARAALFRKIPQAQVQACIDATNAMTCTEFLDMYSTGNGVPAPCQGILD